MTHDKPGVCPGCNGELPAEDGEKHRVWFRWGETEPTDPTLYEFDTLAELNAFLHGVDEACGWLDCEQFDTEEESRASQDDDDEDDDE